MRKATGFAAVLLFGAVLACAASSQAATVVQTSHFNHFHPTGLTDKTTTTLRVGLRYTLPSADQTPVHFAAFDQSLGTLTGVRVALASDQDFGVGLSIVGDGFVNLRQGNYLSSVQFGGQPVGGLYRSYFLDDDEKELPCYAEGFCYRQVQVERDFDFDVAAPDLSPFLAPGGIDFNLASSIYMDTSDIGYLYPGAVFNMAAALTWGGDLSLTYIYDTVMVPTPGGVTGEVPEPATWTMLIAGFGLSGALLRRRRALQLSGPKAA